MRKRERNNEIVPLDIRRIRQALGLSQKEMGVRISLLSQGVKFTPIPETRIAEWEKGWRPVPDYVFITAAKILLNSWSNDRHLTPETRQRDVDAYYGKVLNVPLGEMFRLEQQLALSRNPNQRKLVKKARHVRLSHMKYLETVLHVEMNYVFDPDPSGIAPLEDVA
jgi:transcriptional regulator with XRE-family HTH domain